MDPQTTPHAQRAMLAKLRHELRTPLNAVIGYSEMLLADAAEQGQDRLIPELHRIQKTGRELLALINDVLDPVKIEAGKLDVDPRTLEAELRQVLLTPINAVVGYSEMLLEDARERGPGNFVSDLQKIRTAAQCFLALINDVVKFSKAQAVEADTHIQPMSAPSDTLSMSQDMVRSIPPLGEDVPCREATKTGSLLVVDDNESNRELLARHLRRQGHVVTLAENGRQALDTLRRDRFDLVLLDVMMPELNGYQLLQQLKSDAAWRDIPVIMISALDEIDSVVRCIEIGAEDYLPKPFDPVLLRARTNACLEKKRFHDQEVIYLSRIEKEKEYSEKLVNIVIPIGVALTAEKDFNHLLEMILLQAKSLCNADGGTLYLRTQDDRLKFAIMRNDSLNIHLGGTTGQEIPFPPLPMYDETSAEPNEHNVATYVALSGVAVNIADVYEAEGFDFSGTKEFDKNTSYRSKSCLTIPLMNDANRVIGALQLLNALDPETGRIIPFDEYLQQLIGSLAMLAAVALNVYIREQSLRQQIEQLRIKIDQVKQARQVAEITETEYFRRLQAEAQSLRDILEGSSE
jgi:DNA-binding response OmpR family regulator